VLWLALSPQHWRFAPLPPFSLTLTSDVRSLLIFAHLRKYPIIFLNHASIYVATDL
jgi:hypothetical protein